MTAITTSAKVAHNFPRSLLRTVYNRCNCNDAISRFEVAPGELRATLLSRGQDGETHNRLGAASAEGTGGTGRPDCDARGLRQGMAVAGQRIDAPSEARGADGSRASCRPRRSQAPQPGPPPPGTPAAPQATLQHQRQHTTNPPGPAGAGRLTQYQRIIEESRQCRDYRGRFPGARSRCRASRRCPWRCLPAGNPRRRR